MTVMAMVGAVVCVMAMVAAAVPPEHQIGLMMLAGGAALVGQGHPGRAVGLALVSVLVMPVVLFVTLGTGILALHVTEQLGEGSLWMFVLVSGTTFLGTITAASRIDRPEGAVGAIGSWLGWAALFAGWSWLALLILLEQTEGWLDLPF